MIVSKKSESNTVPKIQLIKCSQPKKCPICRTLCEADDTEEIYVCVFCSFGIRKIGSSANDAEHEEKNIYEHIAPHLLRQRRLENEYLELMMINGDVINIEPLGVAPHDSYKIIFKIRTIISPIPTYEDLLECTLTIPPEYPEVAPAITANNTPYPWHVNWFQNGRWCFGAWNREEPLVSYLYRCAKTLQFDPVFTNPNDAANNAAIAFCNDNENNKNIIPCDKKTIPTIS